MEHLQFILFKSSFLKSLFGYNTETDVKSKVDFSFDTAFDEENGKFYEGIVNMTEIVDGMDDSIFRQEIFFHSEFNRVDIENLDVVSTVHVSRCLKGPDCDGKLKIDNFVSLPHDYVNYTFECVDTFHKLPSGRILHVNSLDNIAEVIDLENNTYISYSHDTIDKNDIDYNEIVDFLSYKSLFI